MTGPPRLVRCPGCHALVADADEATHAYIGASAGCWAVHGEVSARWAGHAAWPLAVDAYAVQHPGVPGRRSSQSVQVHLASLCLILEHGWSPAMGRMAKQRLLAGRRTWEWLEPPADPGPLTILDLVSVDDPAVFDAAVRRWGRAVWDAWRVHQPIARRSALRVLR